MLLVLKDIFRVPWLAWVCLPFWLLLPLQDKPMQGLAGPQMACFCPVGLHLLHLFPPQQAHSGFLGPVGTYSVLLGLLGSMLPGQQ